MHPLTSVVPSSMILLHSLVPHHNLHPQLLTPDMVNQMIINALASINISGTDSPLSHTLYLDFGASNHMTSSPATSQNVVPYIGTLTVQTANGDHLYSFLLVIPLAHYH